MQQTEFFSKTSNIKVRVVADSYNPISETRLTTFEWEYPRFIHGEIMTHRMLSKNAASSRAVPMLKAIENIQANPAWPVHFGANQPGMMARQELEGTDLQAAKSLWSRAMHQALEYGRSLADLGAHKQWAARILEPFQMMKIVVSGTDWKNFLWLRHDEEAQPEFQELARLVQEAFDTHEPEILEPGQWHTPYVEHNWTDGVMTYIDHNGDELTLEDALKISASCCAQVSYRKLDQTKEKALEIYGKLFSGRKPHMSPTEHQGTPMDVFTEAGMAGVTHLNFNRRMYYSGNFCEWIQYRQTLPNNVKPE